MTRIILIHGAWGSAQTWDFVVPLLKAKGHDVTAVTLPGHGADSRDPGEVGMDDYIAHVSEIVADGPPALLVGHSMGGMVISGTAEQVPGSIRKLVYVAALLPRSGESLLDLIKGQDTMGLVEAVRQGRIPMTTELDPETAAPILYPEATDEQRACATYVAEPNRAQTDPVTLGEKFASRPRAYVFTARDKVVTYPLQKAMVAHTPCAETFTLDCGHVPQLTRSKELAAILDRL
ncbi:alpha/beta hydrolase [Defluviimonas sp. 20V17]|uniref:Esterase n=1 Tax=Allgaiera indica TaxID=765699 RepID=A0AAN4USG3_9RHOB|nr:alpha/beta hydrolase [Allgaiera indica]KDB02052.1 alpha/beta hydrolase [Defluviimonas sp. 20V17]GHE03104.1 esterase [Allgaiera indica]SDX11349.1 Pimeloyl-ACP methyl ester carboxylesterase [Allgaiera indica]